MSDEHDRLERAATRLQEISVQLGDEGLSDADAVELAREAAQIAADAGTLASDAARAAAQRGNESA
ncbi:MAG: hypothetical protein R2700_14605 [Solirubrobacterales bacterium]